MAYSPALLNQQDVELVNVLRGYQGLQQFSGFLQGNPGID